MLSICQLAFAGVLVLALSGQCVSVDAFLNQFVSSKRFVRTDFDKNGLENNKLFSPPSLPAQRHNVRLWSTPVVTQKEAQIGINKVVNALRNDRAACTELGRLEKVTIVLGYGRPAGNLALRFNASFRKTGMGRSAVPLPFGLGQSSVAEGRGSMVGQVKATVDAKTGKVTSCSVFRDLGYGRSFQLKV